LNVPTSETSPSGTLHGEGWQLPTDVSGQPIHPIYPWRWNQ